jgi:hypothetical protein
MTTQTPAADTRHEPWGVTYTKYADRVSQTQVALEEEAHTQSIALGGGRRSLQSLLCVCLAVHPCDQ